MIKAILFDWHGVLDKRTFAGMLETLARAWHQHIQELSFEDYHKLIVNNFYKDGFEYAAGNISPSEFWSLLEYEGEESGVYKARDYLLHVERNEALWSQLPKLKERYKLVVLSDCPKDKKEFIHRNVDLSLFDYTYFSCDHKLLKSNPEFFKLALRDLDLPASYCLFVDDSEKNVEYARRLGFMTLCYNDNTDLERALV